MMELPLFDRTSGGEREKDVAGFIWVFVLISRYTSVATCSFFVTLAIWGGSATT